MCVFSTRMYNIHTILLDFHTCGDSIFNSQLSSLKLTWAVVFAFYNRSRKGVCRFDNQCCPQSRITIGKLNCRTTDGQKCSYTSHYSDIYHADRSVDHRRNVHIDYEICTGFIIKPFTISYYCVNV